ncbi:Putative Zn-dependent protease, contains TPR repeats [Colwellia chukchiensis]|uniref:Putative beta-barrel assembly-enhancing protease n=1 Tax=Colwellia chukchiensis TaxID=641665 RepID=A0A1H7M0A1_9GAMM|nr:M48 family metalloprotease [Colwellia chukchiensis]SEL04646.1 Putative Zn-dependent protease, contains TPR repeats [Colwellia chukchiensis]
MFKLAPALIAIVLASTTASYALAANEQSNRNKLPEIGSAGFSVLSIEKERQIGSEMMRQIRASQPILHDPVLTEYINDLGNRLVRHAKDVNYSFEFFVIKNQELNAFAFFGGHIAIHSGLITTANTESELASVVAHEISHVTQRHLARRLEEQNRAQPLTMAGLVSGVLLTLINPSVGMAALNTTIAASQQAGINYTRGNEKEADRVGIELLANSGFNPQGAPDFFSIMAEKYRYTSKPPAMLLTHPLPESRISDARVRAQNYFPRPLAPSLQFELAKARISARYEGNAQDNIQHYQQQIDKQRYAIKAAAQYGLALALYENKEYQRAITQLESLFHNDKKNLFYADALTDAYIAVKAYSKAIDMLAELNLLMPNNQVVTLNYANALTEAKQYSEAEMLLQDYLTLNPQNFIANDLLTTVYRKQNKLALMHATKAEVYALLGAYPKAIDELQTGYNYAQDNRLLKKRMQGRILQLQAQQARLKRL